MRVKEFLCVWAMDYFLLNREKDNLALLYPLLDIYEQIFYSDEDMFYHHLFFFYLLYGTFVDMTTVPVFLYDCESVPSATDVNPLETLQQPDFMELVQQVRKRSSSFIIFIEKEFCTEDISTKDMLGSPFYNLHQAFTEQKVRYFPSVLQPYELLKQIFRPQANNVFYLKDKMSKVDIHDNRLKYFYVFFEDYANETRVRALRRHDSIINEVYQLVKQFHSGPVALLYTGRTNQMIPQLSHAPFSAKKDPNTASILSTYVMFRLSGVSLFKAGIRWPLTDKVKFGYEWFGGYRSDNMPVVGFDITDFRLNFQFKYDDKGWRLVYISWREIQKKIRNEKDLEGGKHIGITNTTNMRAPWNVSFACNEPIHIVSKRDNSIVTISNYQIEVVKQWLEDEAVTKSSKVQRQFVRTVNCQPFFSAALVTILFVNFVCLAILFFGVLMMMDCNSNNRFDDPLSEPLTITENIH